MLKAPAPGSPQTPSSRTFHKQPSQPQPEPRVQQPPHAGQQGATWLPVAPPPAHQQQPAQHLRHRPMTYTTRCLAAHAHTPPPAQARGLCTTTGTLPPCFYAATAVASQWLARSRTLNRRLAPGCSNDHHTTYGWDCVDRRSTLNLLARHRGPRACGVNVPPRLGCLLGVVLARRDRGSLHHSGNCRQQGQHVAAAAQGGSRGLQTYCRLAPILQQS
jgi:hypothetical protein